jgi:hypothetical protein
MQVFEKFSRIILTGDGSNFVVQVWFSVFRELVMFFPELFCPLVKVGVQIDKVTVVPILFAIIVK